MLSIGAPFMHVLSEYGHLQELRKFSEKLNIFDYKR